MICLLRFSALCVTALHASVIGVVAQTVNVQNGLNENGFGWMFRSGGTCYAVMPRHVAGPLPRVTLTTAAPVANGSGSVIHPFWPGLDLSIAVVRGGIEARCTETLDRLDLSRRAGRAARAELHRLDPTGEEERIAISLERRNYLTIDGEVATNNAEIYQGTSGAFAFVGEEPIGMAITSDDPKRLVLMRSEEILMNLRRYLSEQSNAFAAETAPAPAHQEGGFVLNLVSVSAPPISPEFDAQNVLGDGIYVFSPQRNAEIILRVESDDPVALSRIRVKTPQDSGYVVPRRILILTDAQLEGDGFSVWTRGEMPPDGNFDTGPMATRNALWVKVMILSGWGSGEIAISEISAQ